MRNIRGCRLLAVLLVVAGCSKPGPATPGATGATATRPEPTVDAFAVDIAPGEPALSGLESALQREADSARRQDNPRIFERQVLICGEPETPWGRIQSVMMACARAGIYRIDWRASRSNKDASVMHAWLPIDAGMRPAPAPAQAPGPATSLEEIYVYLRLDGQSGELIRKVNAKRLLTDEDIAATLADGVEKYRNLGKTDVPIVVHADPEVRWEDVIKAASLCRAANPTRVEFAAPMPEGGADTGGDRTPEMEKPRDVYGGKGSEEDDEPAIRFPDGDESDHSETPDDEKAEKKEDPGTGKAETPYHVGGGGGRFGHRLGGRRNLVARCGGTQGPGGTELAVTEGLRWLARHQGPEGNWSADSFNSRCSGAECPGKGNHEHDAGLTGLALLAFLGAGYTHVTRESYEDPHSGNTINWGYVISQGLHWLIQHQSDDGCFGDRKSSKSMYNHAIATAALAETHGLTGSRLCGDCAQKGIDFLLAAQNVRRAWRYTSRCGDNDTSVTGWCVMALKSADLSRLTVGGTGYDGARAFLSEVTDEKTFKVGYTAGGTGKVVIPGRNEDWDDHESLTAVGMLCRIVADRNRHDPALETGAKLLVADLPTSTGKKIDYYYWYYGTFAVFQFDGPDGKYWKGWNEAMKQALVPSQKTKKDGCADGSWDSDADRWGFEGGRVYATAINVLTLETYYRYPILLREK